MHHAQSYNRLRIDKALGFENLITTRTRSQRTTFVAIVDPLPGPEIKVVPLYIPQSV